MNDANDNGSTINETRMPFFEHLAELAARLKKCLISFMVSFVIVSSLPNPLNPFGGPDSLFGYNFLVIALLRWAENRYATGFEFLAARVTAPVSVFFDLSLVLSLVIALPYMFYQIYGFVAPGLYQREKNAVRKYVAPFAGLFAIGGIFGLVIVFPTVIRILLAFYPALGLASLVSLEDFVHLLLLVSIVNGVAFTFPVFLIPLVEFKILSSKQLSSARKWVYILVALAAGIVNPDPTFISCVPIIAPIYVLYEITVFISKRIEAGRLTHLLQ